MNDLSDSMFTTTGEANKIFRADSAGRLITPSLSSTSGAPLRISLKGLDNYWGMYYQLAGEAAFNPALVAPGCSVVGITSPAVRISTYKWGTGGLIYESSDGGNPVAQFAVNSSTGNAYVRGTMAIGGTTSASLLGTDSTGLVVARTASSDAGNSTYVVRSSGGRVGLHWLQGPSADTLRILVNATDPNWGISYAIAGGLALNPAVNASGCPSIGIAGAALRFMTYTSSNGGLIYETTDGTAGATATPQFAVHATTGNAYVRGTLTVASVTASGQGAFSSARLTGTLTIGGTTDAALLGTDSTGLVSSRTASSASVVNTYPVRASDGSCGFHTVTGPASTPLRVLINGTDTNWGITYAGATNVSLNQNTISPSCDSIGVTGPAIRLCTYKHAATGLIYESTTGTAGSTNAALFGVNSSTGNTYVGGTLTIGGSTIRAGPAATVSSSTKMTLRSDADLAVIDGDANGAQFAINSTNPGVILRAEGVDVLALNKTHVFSMVARHTTLDIEGLDIRIDNAGLIGLPGSAAKYKTDIVDMEDTSSIYQLRPVNFRYKKDPPGTKSYGLIADEAVLVCPDLVRMQDGEVEGLYDHKLPFMLLNELQKLRATVTAQQAAIDDLRTGMAALLELVKSKLQ